MVSSNLISQFEKLSAKRQRLLEAIEENFAQGLLTQLTNIYPDEAHFIYELLQNAEDAEATEVYFYLHSTGLRFRHNGKIQFEIDHIDAITNYDRTTKKISDNKIGKFGVGFKSVFSYTRKPIINSNGLTFSISRAILPKMEVLIEEEKLFKESWTTFLINFDEPTKVPKKAFKEVKNGLEELDEKSLMFLSNIKKISLTIKMEKPLQRTIISEPVQGRITKFSIQSETNPKETYYYLINEKMPSIDKGALDPDAINKLEKLTIGLSFKLEKNQESFQIIPAEDASVCVFFPAVKEFSGLKFHIHAPFSSTPSRDVIKNSDENRTIITGLARVLSNHLSNFAELKLIDESFLASLPNSEDQLAPMYEIFRTEILRVFMSSGKFIPSLNKNYISSYKAVSANAQFQSAINGKILDQFISLHNKYPDEDFAYIANMKNSRAQKFLQSLNITNLNFSFLRETLLICQNSKKIDQLQTMLSSLPIENLKRFFSLFAQNSSLFWSDIHQVRFIPVNSTKVHFLSPEEAFLPSMKFNSGEMIVKSALVNPLLPNSDELDKMVLSGLRNLEVETLDDLAMLNIKMDSLSERHNFGDVVKEEEIESAFNEISQLLIDARGDSEILKMISTLTYFIGKSIEGQLIWTSLDRVFVDAPYRLSGLKSVQKFLPVTNTTELHSIYSQLEDFRLLVDSSKALQRVVPRKQVYSDGSSDWIVDKFDEMLEQGDIEFALEIWQQLILEKNESLRWERKVERIGQRSTYSDSSFVSALQFSKWLPDSNGQRRRPRLMNRESLHRDFVFHETALIRAINFDGDSKEKIEAEKRKAEELEEKNLKARELGFSDFEEVEIYKKLKQYHPEVIANLVSSLDSHFPEETVSDLEEKILKTTELIGSAAEVKIVESIIRERNNYKARHSEMKNYARSKYQVGGIMKCQACNLNMPFKLANGDHYFEAVYLFKDLKKEFVCNILALCPTCAAKYKYAFESNLLLLKNEIQKAKISGIGTVQFKIEMASGEYLLTFTEDHFLEIQTVLKGIEI